MSRVQRLSSGAAAGYWLQISGQLSPAEFWAHCAERGLGPPAPDGADPDDTVTIDVDGARVDLHVWPAEDQDGCWAAGHHGGRGLVLEARLVPVEDVGLHRVHDLEPYLEGRRRYLRELRGGI